LFALVAGAWAADVVSAADEARTAYGTTREVTVVLRDIDPGVSVRESDVEVRSLPDVAIPDGAAVDPVGRTVRHPLVAGEVVVESRLAGGDGGPAALIGPGRRAISLPRSERGLALAVGDVVDVLAPESPDGGASSGGARRVARSAEVVGADEDTVTVAVSATETPGVARAVLDGAVTVALVGAVP
jgi:Flp pilus assembly protein CpaB